MKTKKISTVILLLIFCSLTLFKVRGKEKSLIVNIEYEIGSEEKIIITNNDFSIKYDETIEELIFKNKQNEIIDIINLSYDRKAEITILGSFEILIELAGNDSFEGIAMTNSDLVSLVIDNYNAYVIVNDSVMFHDSEGFEVNIKWNFMKGEEKNHVIINDVNNPYTIEEITKLSGIFAYDEHDGNMEDLIVVLEDNYTDNKNNIGNFKITYTVMNVSGFSTNYVLNVFNMYYGKPIINGPSNVVFEYNEVINIDQLIKNYSASDLYDPNVVVEVIENTIIDNHVGDYYIMIKATNQTMQSETIKVNIKLVDRTKPVFVDNFEGTLKFNFKEMPSKELLLEGLEAYDDYDGDLTKDIKIQINGIELKVGEYFVTYEVRDKAGNRNQYTRKIQIVSEYEPEFFVSKNLLTINGINELSIKEIAEIISNINGIEMTNYRLVLDTYTSSANKAGEYQIQMIITDLDGMDHNITQNIKVVKFNNKNNQKTIVVMIVLFGITTLIINTILIKKIKSANKYL